MGKLTAKLENKAKDPNPQSPIPNPSLATSHYPLFTVRTPTATVTDLGTEFGVEVQHSGATSASVFRGIIEVQPITRNGRRSQAVRVSENQAVRVEKDSSGAGFVARRLAADSAAFVRVEQLPKLAEDLRLKPFRRWQAYSQEFAAIRRYWLITISNWRRGNRPCCATWRPTATNRSTAWSRMPRGAMAV